MKMEFEKVSSVYILTKPHEVVLEEFFPERKGRRGEVENNHEDGKSRLYLKEGMAWDGSTGVANTEMCMEASLVHDWLCHSIDTIWGTNKKLWKKYRKRADKEYYRLLRKNGMSYLRAKTRYAGVRSYAMMKKFFV